MGAVPLVSVGDVLDGLVLVGIGASFYSRVVDAGLLVFYWIWETWLFVTL